jgi:hypothetical protein
MKTAPAKPSFAREPWQPLGLLTTVKPPALRGRHDSPVSMASQYRHATLVLSMDTRSRLMKIIRPMPPLRQRMLEDMQCAA